MGNSCLPNDIEGTGTVTEQEIEENEQLQFKKKGSLKCNNRIYYAVDGDKPSCSAAYETWLTAQSDPGLSDPANCETLTNEKLSNLNIGIIGCGVAGLYSSLLLKQLGVKNITILESNSERIGGRVYSHRFNKESNQYFEAGAMRLPQVAEHQSIFDLIEYLNEEAVEEKDDIIELIPYTLSDDDGNFVFVNNKFKDEDEKSLIHKEFANVNVSTLGFTENATSNKTAHELIEEAVGEYLEKLRTNFEEGFQAILKYDDLSFYSYLRTIKKWSHDKIIYVETLDSGPYAFQKGFTEAVIGIYDFWGDHKWKTIKNGMDRLPKTMATYIGLENIKMGCKVHKIKELKDGSIQVYYNDDESMKFDKIIAAIPPAALRVIDTPQWSVPKMTAIRTFHMGALYKIGLRFKSRFWEKTTKRYNGSKGGQSTTDLPSRWMVYPSYGIGDDGPGVLLLHSWMTGAYLMNGLEETERINIGLRDLQTVYTDINVKNEFIEGFSVHWSASNATGRRFKHIYNVARTPEGNVYFAGEHLSTKHSWIVGAVDSALNACSQIVGDQLDPIRPRKNKKKIKPHDYDYSRCF